MSHTLPARPTFLPAPPEPVLAPSLVDLAESSAGPSTPGACVICSSAPKYTCPGCNRRTCSLSCSKAHKDRFECSGTREASAYVPLNSVTEGTWSDDYRYLEESRRKIAEWGGKLPAGVLAHEAQNKGTKRKRPGGGGKNMALKGLEMELRKRGICVEFMAEGMERRRKNQSAWNPKTNTLYLSVQLIISPRVMGSAEERTVNQSRLSFSSTSPLHTLQSVLPADIQTSDLVFVLPYHQLQKDQPLYPAGGSISRFFPPLDPGISIIDALKGTTFVESPIIRVFKVEEWEKMLSDRRAIILPLSQDAGVAPYVISTSKARSLKQPAQTSSTPVPSCFSASSVKAAPSPVTVAPTKPLGSGLVDYGSEDEDEEP